MLHPLSFERNPVIATLALLTIAVSAAPVAMSLTAESMSMCESAEEQANRNAQNLVSIYEAARSSGVRIHPATLDELINALSAGATPEDSASPYYGKRLSIGTLSPQARADMIQYLHYDARSGELDYLPTPEEEDTKSCCD